MDKEQLVFSYFRVTTGPVLEEFLNSILYSNILAVTLEQKELLEQFHVTVMPVKSLDNKETYLYSVDGKHWFRIKLITTEDYNKFIYQSHGLERDPIVTFEKVTPLDNGGIDITYSMTTKKGDLEQIKTIVSKKFLLDMKQTKSDCIVENYLTKSLKHNLKKFQDILLEEQKENTD